MRSNPFDEMERTFERLSRQFEDAARSWEDEWLGPDRGGLADRTGDWGAMGIDVADRDDEFVVTADVPGFETEDIDLELRGDALYIHAEESGESEETDETEESEGTYLRSERHHRRLSDSVRLPEPVDEDAVTATCRNGVLTVRLPKAEPSKSARKIDIE